MENEHIHTYTVLIKLQCPYPRMVNELETYEHIEVHAELGSISDIKQSDFSVSAWHDCQVNHIKISTICFLSLHFKIEKAFSPLMSLC